MVGRLFRLRKGAAVRFALPPWTREAREWQAIDQRLPQDHWARKIDEGVKLLDLTSLYESYCGRGDAPYPPELLLKAVLYEMQVGRQSPAQWARDARENEPLQWLLLGAQPSRSRWYAFRDRLGELIDVWMVQVLERAVEWNLTDGSRAALDGTTIAAQASRHKLINEKTLHRRLGELQQVVAQDEAWQQALAEKKLPPESSSVSGWMAKHAPTRAKQRQQYVEAAERMKRIQEENARRMPSLRRDPKKIVISLTDPQAALGMDKHKLFRPLYNVQFVRDLDSPLVLAYEVFAQSSDAGTLGAMLDRHAHFLRCKLQILLADAGYATALDLAICDQHSVTLVVPWQENDYSTKTDESAKKSTKIPKSEFEWVAELDIYRCPEGHALKFVGQETRSRAGGLSATLRSYQCPPIHCCGCPRREGCVSNPKAGRRVRRNEHEALIDALKQRMQTPETKQLYKLRRQTVELQFADLKVHRSLRRFSGRGLRRARIQTGLAALVHNLLIVVRAGESKQHEPTGELITVENTH